MDGQTDEGLLLYHGKRLKLRRSSFLEEVAAAPSVVRVGFGPSVAP